MTSVSTRQIYDFLMQSQYFAEGQMQAQQLHQLEQLARFAHKNVEFYKDRLGILFNQKDQFDFSRWRTIPVLTRQDLIDHRDRLLAPVLPAGHGQIANHEGSGTTGSTLTTTHNTLIWTASEAAKFRSWTWHEMDYARTYFQWFGGHADRPDGAIGGPWGPAWDEASAKGRACSLSRVEPAASAVDLMTTYGASYASGRPNALLELAHEVERRRAKVTLKGMISFGAQLTETTREECRRIFGTEIFEFYSSKEVYNIAHQCPHGRLHINSELMLVEVLDEKGAPCPPGTTGRIVVTPFYNTIQPFIRYDLGDMVTLGEPCTCGRTLPVIASLDGRTIHLFRLTGGRRISLRLPAGVRKSIGGLEWQVAQTSLENIEIRYLKVGDAPSEAFDNIVRMIRSQMSPDIQIAFKPVTKLPQTASGKVLEQVCEIEG